MSLGNFMIGEEGQAVWRIYASPVSPKSLIKSKYFFIVSFSLVVLAITGIVGFAVYQPSLRATIVACFEAVFLVFALGIISLSKGISGADFTETPRPRMIRQSASIVNLVACLLAGIAVLAPFLPYVLSLMSGLIPALLGGAFLDPFLALVLSAVIAVVLTVIFYRIALKNARDLITKAET
jgi:cytochrome b subunit of formate dehydrogenase